MLNKCINCIKWITCKDASKNIKNCNGFIFKRINYYDKIKGDRNGKK